MSWILDRFFGDFSKKSWTWTEELKAAVLAQKLEEAVPAAQRSSWRGSEELKEAVRAAGGDPSCRIK